jgi:tetratricopeptide (TPR) repeat protein
MDSDLANRNIQNRQPLREKFARILESRVGISTYLSFAVGVIICVYQYSLQLLPIFSLLLLTFVFAWVLSVRRGLWWMQTAICVFVTMAVYPRISELWPSSIDPPSDSEVLIIVCEFENHGTKEYNFASPIVETIRHELHANKITDIRCETWEALDNSLQAEELCASSQATLVLWGICDDAGVTSYFTASRSIMSQSELYSNSLSSFPSESPLQLYLAREQIVSKFNALCLFTLGLAKSFRQDATQAAALFQSAIDACNRAIKVSGRADGASMVGLPYYFLGNSLLMLKRPPVEIIRCYDSAVHAGFRRAGLFNNRAALNIMLGRPSDAVKDCDLAISIDSGYARAYYQRALARLKLNLNDEAANDFLTTIDMDSSNFKAMTNLGILNYRVFHNNYAALHWFNHALSVKADHYNALKNRAEVRLYLNDYAGAAMDFDACARLHPQKDSSRMTLYSVWASTPSYQESLRDSFMKTMNSELHIPTDY